MNHTEIASKTAAYLNTFLGKEGFLLLKTEFVREDGIFYLRAYIDLTDEEREKRKKKLESGKEKREADDPAETAGTAETSEVPETSGNGPEEEGSEPAEEGPAEPGIGINDCALVSRRLSRWLDKEDFIPEEYMLEVCSKGYLN